MDKVGSWVKRSRDHVISHRILRKERNVFITRCWQRIGVNVAVDEPGDQDRTFRCSGCEHADDLVVHASREVAAAAR